MADGSAARRSRPDPGKDEKKSAGQAANRRRPRTRTAASLDRLIHERVRLAIVSALAVAPALSHNDLRDIVGTSDGNLSVHARKLEDAGYLECTKSFDGRVPRTEYALTSEGRKALERYLAHMESIIRMTRGEEAGQ